MYSIITIVDILSIIGMFTIVGVVATSKPSRDRVPFILTVLAAAMWLSLQAIAQFTPGVSGDLLLIQLSVALSPWLAIAGAKFIFSYMGSTLPAYFWVAASVVAVLFSALSLSGLIVRDATANRAGIAINDATFLYYGELLFIAALFLYAIVRLVLATLRLRGNARARNIVLIVSFLQAVFLSIVGSAFFSGQEVTQLFITVSIFLFCVVIAIGMVRHKLFDIRLAAVRSLAYVLSLAALSGIYYTVAYLISVVIFKEQVNSSLSVGPLNIFLALVLAFAFQPIRGFFDKVTNSIFYRDNYDAEDFIARINKISTSTSDLRTLLHRIALEVGSTLKAEYVSFLVHQADGRRVLVGSDPYRGVLAQDVALLDEFVANYDEAIIITDLLPANHAIRRLLRKRDIAIVLPLMQAGKVIGYLTLGDQKSGRYVERDVKVLSTISDGLVVTVQNSLSVQEIKDFNEHLQQKIDAATAELRTSNAQLRHLDATKDEFVSMASHQLRTPLTSVKGYISMVLDGDAGKITDMQRQLLGEAFTSSERMVHLINDFLNVSRLQTGKFMIDRQAVDFAKVVEQEVQSLQSTAHARNLTLQYRKPSKFPILYLDEGKLRQVVMNFIDNAFYYSREHSTVTVVLEAVAGEVILRVKDAGMGVPEAEQKRLFTKFFRATNARKQRPDGTGVGLFLAKKVVTAHGGSVIFESVEGKGSTFGFRLPVKKLSLAPAEGAN